MRNSCQRRVIPSSLALIISHQPGIANFLSSSQVFRLVEKKKWMRFLKAVTQAAEQALAALSERCASVTVMLPFQVRVSDHAWERAHTIPHLFLFCVPLFLCRNSGEKGTVKRQKSWPNEAGKKWNEVREFLQTCEASRILNAESIANADIRGSSVY